MNWSEYTDERLADLTYEGLMALRDQVRAACRDEGETIDGEAWALRFRLIKAMVQRHTGQALT